MEIATLKAILDQAVGALLCEAPTLLQVDAHEVAIAHRLAVYLEPFFQGFHVDIEYNRDMDEVKRGCNGQGVRPDIVVHRRKELGQNLLIAEIKKSSSQVGIESDRERLREMTTDSGKYSYEHGVAFVFDCENGVLMEQHWFQDGREIE